MRTPILFHVIIASCLTFSCAAEGEGQADTASPKIPAIAVPTHILTEDRAGTSIRAEAGDKIEVHLREPDGHMRWVQQGETGLVLLGLRTGELRRDKKGLVRVFRYQTRSTGKIRLDFDLADPNSDAGEARTVSFTINIL